MNIYLVDIVFLSMFTIYIAVYGRRGAEDEKEYLVKWKELPYDECSWELQSDISSFQSEIDKFNRIRSRYGKETLKKPKSNRDAALKAKQKEFQQYEKSPEFLTGGMELSILS